MKVQARMEDKVRIKNLKSLLAFFEKLVGRARERANIIGLDMAAAVPLHVI